jgi:hypothetical protein
MGIWKSVLILFVVPIKINVVIEASRMHVEARGIYIHDRGAEQVHAVFVPKTRVEPIEASTRLASNR